MATNQSEAGWAGSRERLLLRRGWRPGAARTVSRCSSLTVSLTRARRNPAPWPAPHSRGRKMESRCPREVPPARARPLAPLSRRPEASLPLARTLCPRRPGPSASPGRAPRLGAPTRVRRQAGCGPGAKLRAGPQGGEPPPPPARPQRRASPSQQVGGSRRHLAGAAPGMSFSVLPAGAPRATCPPGAVRFWNRLLSRWGRGLGDLIFGVFGGLLAYLSTTVMGVIFCVRI